MTDLIERLIEIGGCGDGGCQVHVRPGMHTNGGCQCLNDGIKAQQVVYAYKREVTRQREVIERWKRECDKLEAERDRAETTGFVAPINDKRPAQSTGEWEEYWQRGNR